MKTNHIVLDTNVLLIPGKSPSRDIFEELQKLLGKYEAIIPQFVMEELEKLARKKTKGGHPSKRSRHAKMGLQLVDEYTAREQADMSETAFYKVRVEPASKGSKTVDDALIEFALKLGAYLATADKALKAKAEKAGAETVFLGSKKYPKRARSKQ